MTILRGRLPPPKVRISVPGLIPCTDFSVDPDASSPSAVEVALRRELQRTQRQKYEYLGRWVEATVLKKRAEKRLQSALEKMRHGD